MVVSGEGRRTGRGGKRPVRPFVTGPAAVARTPGCCATRPFPNGRATPFCPSPWAGEGGGAPARPAPAPPRFLLHLLIGLDVVTGLGGGAEGAVGLLLLVL